MARRVEEDSGIDGPRLRLLAKRLSAIAPRGRWWPYDEPFEIALSAVLTQRTRWQGAAQAMENLRAEGLLTPPALASAPRATVERALRPAGFYRQKARSLQGIATRICGGFGGRFERVLELPTPQLRAEILSWTGVGEETADAILLFAAGRPAFVVDAYAVRLMRRFGAVREGALPPPAAVRDAWMRTLGNRPGASKAAHAAIVELCKSHCTREPACGTCPVRVPCPKVGVAASVKR